MTHSPALLIAVDAMLSPARGPRRSAAASVRHRVPLREADPLPPATGSRGSVIRWLFRASS